MSRAMKRESDTRAWFPALTISLTDLDFPKDSGIVSKRVICPRSTNLTRLCTMKPYVPPTVTAATKDVASIFPETVRSAMLKLKVEQNVIFTTTRKETRDSSIYLESFDSLNEDPLRCHGSPEHWHPVLPARPRRPWEWPPLEPQKYRG